MAVISNFKPVNESYWVEPGRLLAGEHPGHLEDSVVRRRLCALLDSGVRVFVDLSERADAVHSYKPMLDKLARERGTVVDYRWKPLPSNAVPEHAEDMLDVLRAVEDGLASGSRVYVHCSNGVDRTGMVIGCWLVERGFDPEAALDELGRRFSAMAKAMVYRSTPSNAFQAEWVENWQPKLGLRKTQSLAS